MAFIFYSNRLGCFGSILISILASTLLIGILLLSNRALN